MVRGSIGGVGQTSSEVTLKDQYFADKRDFFKWDLLEDLVALPPGRRALCYIAMLTPPDGTKEGVFKQYDTGARRGELHAFLQSCASCGRREVKAMRDYFVCRGVDYRPIGDTPAEYYDPASSIHPVCHRLPLAAPRHERSVRRSPRRKGLTA